MNNKLKLFTLCMLFSISLMCIEKKEMGLDAGIKQYNNGNKTSAITTIEKGILDIISVWRWENGDITSNNNLLYHRNSDLLKLVYPIEKEIEIDKDYNIIRYDPNTKRTLLCNGTKIKIYNQEGLLIKDISSQSYEKKESNIKALGLIKGRLYVYRNRKIYLYDLSLNDNKPFLRDRFSPPYSHSYYYDVKFYLYKNKLAFVVGSGGSYNLSVIDVDNNKIMINNQKISSSKISFNDVDIYCITGSTGRWVLTRISVLTKKITKLLKLNNLTDLEFSSQGILFEKIDELWIYKYNYRNLERIPFRFELVGSCNENILIKYNNKYYLIDLINLFDQIVYLKNIIPEIFENRKNSVKQKTQK
ncbi:MAG: hypothetical protein SVR08_13385 [Spirochaetota bacterium]|nr:hypothetical protein [Spirochaetota bacterium]